MQGALLEVAQRTDPGRDPDKQVNEDSAGHRVTKLGHLLVVCDGMGGHALGREASQLAVSTIFQCVDSAAPVIAPGAALAQAIVEAGRRVYAMGGAGPQAGRPGSTCVALLVHGSAVEVAHVGDSRGYLIRNGHIWPITKDHSVVQQMLDQGAITPEQALVHPEGNKITRALGMKPETDVELRDPPMLQAVGDIFVLASDGLTDLVRPEEIGSVVGQAASLDLAGQNLIAMANARGGHDNITVVLARVLPGGAAGAPIPNEPVLPTIVQTRGGNVPEKTLIDRSRGSQHGAPQPVVPTVPHTPVQSPLPSAQGAPPGGVVFPPPAAGVPPFAAGAPSGPPVTAPLPAMDLPPGVQRSASPPATIPPAPPSRSGLIVAMAVLMALFLVGMVVWWILRGR